MGLFPTNPLFLLRVQGDLVHWVVDELPSLWSHSHPNHDQLLGGGRGRNFWKQENKSIASKLYIALIPQLVCNSEGLQTVRLLCNNPWDQIHIELKDFEERNATKISPGCTPVYTSKGSVPVNVFSKNVRHFPQFFYLQRLFSPLNVFPVSDIYCSLSLLQCYS